MHERPISLKYCSQMCLQLWDHLSKNRAPQHLRQFGQKFLGRANWWLQQLSSWWVSDDGGGDAGSGGHAYGKEVSRQSNGNSMATARPPQKPCDTCGCATLKWPCTVGSLKDSLSFCVCIVTEGLCRYCIISDHHRDASPSSQSL